MFDKLVVSEPDKADFKDRRRYFMVSSIVVGILFATAVVVSIFAADYGIGSGNFELAEMIAPVDMAAVAPQVEPPRPQASQSQSQSNSTQPMSNIASVNEPNFVPTTTSAVANPFPSREYAKFGDRISPGEPVVGNNIGRNASDNNGPGGLSSDKPVADGAETETAPPSIKKATPSNVIKSIGVANGKATYLPKPAYPATAIALRLEGKVDVQVMIDEKGNVVSAKAVNGHPFFRNVAEQSARSAKFSPTLLSNVPVKVTGVIVYNFTRN